VVDISHPNFEEQIDIVNKTLDEINASEKPTVMVFNKVDAFTYEKKDEDDLTPSTKANTSLDEWKKTWMAKSGESVFISALQKENFDGFRDLLYEMAKEIHAKRFPYNSFLY
jgi:GTP-binding protein HflX